MTDEAAALLGQTIADALETLATAIPDLHTAILLLVSTVLLVGIMAWAVVKRDTIAYVIASLGIISFAWQELPLYVATPVTAAGLYLMLRAGLIHFRERGG